MFQLPVLPTLPNPYVILGVFAALVISWFAGDYHGYSKEHDKFVTFQTQVKDEGQRQIAKNESVVKQNEIVTEGVKNEYEARIAAVHAYYSRRVQYANPGSGGVPSISKPSPGANGSTSDPEFVGRCAETTTQLISLQEWIRLQSEVLK